MCNDNTDCRCISDILKVINILQKKAERHEEDEDLCDRKTLGHSCCLECNTRPVQLFLCGQNGDDPLIMPTDKKPITPATRFSSVFRVERVDDCCATFRVLKKKHEHDKKEDNSSSEECEEFEATDSFFTLDLKCVCIIRCLEDTFVECV
jgi:hypothetical protein